MKPRIVITQATPIEFEYLQKIVETIKGLGTPYIKTGFTWNGRYKVIMEWLHE